MSAPDLPPSDVPHPPAAPSVDEWFRRLSDTATAWQSADGAHAARIDLGPTDPDSLARQTVLFCEHAGSQRALLTDEQLGRSIWYWCGVGRSVWFRIKKADPPLAASAVRSLEHLYRDLFATLPHREQGPTRGRLESACFMLWDMDGGLSSLLLNGRPHLREACEGVIDTALSLDSPACWHSALHGLGHAAATGSRRAKRTIDRFTQHHGAKLGPHLLHYAEAARRGQVQ